MEGSEQADILDLLAGHTDDTTITANWGSEYYVKVQYMSAEQNGTRSAPPPPR